MPYQLIAFGVVLVTSVLVSIDAKRLGAHRGALGGGQLDLGPVSWFFSCLLLFIIGLPCYLWTRPRLVAAKAGRAAQWRASFAPVAPTAQPYSREYAAAYGLPWTEPDVQPAGQQTPAAPSSLGVQLAGVAALVAVLALGVGAGLQAGAHSPKPDAASAPTTHAAARPAAPDLSQVTLRTEDFHNGYRVRPAAQGDQLAGQVTLDNCGFDFTSEAARTARREVYVVDTAGQDTGLSNEVVEYRTDAAAALALRQWHAAAAHCPRRAVRSAVAGTPPLTERVSRNEQHVSGLPNATNLLTVETIKIKGQTLRLIAVLQVRGRVLDALYVLQHRVPTAAEIRGIIVVAAGTGRRLATL